MKGVLVGRYEMRSPEWHAARAGRLGGSEIAAVLGLSEWESPFSLWHRKAGNVDPVDETAPMEWGIRLEPAVITKFLEQHPELVAVEGGTYCSPIDRRFIANPDQLVGPEGGGISAVLEVKTASAFDAWKWANPEADIEGIPVYYRAQGLWYGAVLGLPTVHFAVLIGGSDYREYQLDVDAAIASGEVDALLDAGGRFLDSIAAGEAPDLDGSTRTYQIVRELHPDIDDVEVLLDNDVAVRFIQAIVGLAAATEEECLARALVADAMGTAKRATWDGRTVARRQSKQGGTPFVVAGRGITHLITTTEGTQAA